MKAHYKGDFTAAKLMKQSPQYDEDSSDEEPKK